MIERFYPCEMRDSAYEVEYEEFYEKGYRGILFDIDNTLVGHGAEADERAIALVKRLKETGYRICFVSNNKEPRVKSFCDALDAPYVYKAGKPKGDGYSKGLELLSLPKEQVLAIGDQIFTDTWGANRAGITSILVGQLEKKEEIQIILKRRLEYFVKKSYQRKQGRKKHE